MGCTLKQLYDTAQEATETAKKNPEYLPEALVLVHEYLTFLQSLQEELKELGREEFIREYGKETSDLVEEPEESED